MGAMHEKMPPSQPHPTAGEQPQGLRREPDSLAFAGIAAEKQSIRRLSKCHSTLTPLIVDRIVECAMVESKLDKSRCVGFVACLQSGGWWVGGWVGGQSLNKHNEPNKKARISQRGLFIFLAASSRITRRAPFPTVWSLARLWSWTADGTLRS